jgi:multidrug efflux pump subunit AcrB
MIVSNAAISHRVTVIVAVIGIVLTGLIAYFGLPREAAPDIEFPLITITTPWEGASPADIENNVTRQIEDKLQGIKGVKEINSTSSEGMSSIMVEFDTETAISDARQRVKDKVDEARGDLPTDIEEPIVQEIDVSDMPIIVVTVSGDAGLWTLKDIAEDLQDEFEIVTGVLEANVTGGLEQEIRIEVDPHRLAQYDIQLSRLLTIVGSENVNVTGGNIDTPQGKIQVRVPREFKDPNEIFQLPIATAPDGGHIYLTDVATVKITSKDQETVARLNGVESVSVSVHKRSGANIIDITDRVKEVTEEFFRNMPAQLSPDDIRDWPRFARTVTDPERNGILAVVREALDEETRTRLAEVAAAGAAPPMARQWDIVEGINRMFQRRDLFEEADVEGVVLAEEAQRLYEATREDLSDTEIARLNRLTVEAALPETMARLTRSSITLDFSKDIRTMVSDLENSIVMGLILVGGVLFLFLGVRNATFAAMAIPLSMLMTFVVLAMLGITLNMIVLFSLILALGMLVDCSIVVVENIHRHRTEEGKGRIRAARDGVGEVAWPIITSILTTVVAFAPMLFWPGIMGEFMGYLPRTVIITLICSLAVALTVNPALSAISLFGDNGPLGGGSDEDKRDSFVIRLYKSVLNWSLDRRGFIIASGLSMLLAMVVVYVLFGKGVELFPDIEPRRAYVDVRAPQGTSLEKSNALVREVERRLAPFEDIDYVLTSVGQRSGDFVFGGTKGTHESRVSIEFKDRSERMQSSNDTIDEIREAMRGIPGAEIEVEKENEGPPTGAPVTIEIAGDDFQVLARIARDVKDRIRDIEGLEDLKDNYEASVPEIQFYPDRVRIAETGLDTSTVGQFLRLAIYGREVDKYRTGEDEYDITVRFPEPERDSVSDVLDFTVPDPTGSHVPLASVARPDYAPGQGLIRRVDRQKTITVVGNDSPERRGPAILADVQERLADYPLPPGYSIDYAGENEEQEKAGSFLAKAFIAAVLLIAIVLVTQFNSFLLPFIVLSSVLMSMVGVFLGLLIMDLRFGIIMTGIGCISLAGVVVNNAIVLIDYIEKLRQWGMPMREALLTAGARRLRPVLLTAVTTILGLIPLATGVNIDFRKILGERTLQGVVEIGSETSQWWSPMAWAVIFGLGVATVMTLVVVPCMYALMSRIHDHLSRSDEAIEGPAKQQSANEEDEAVKLPA